MVPAGNTVGGCAPTTRLLTNIDEKTWAVLCTWRVFAITEAVLRDPPILIACPTRVEVTTELTLATVLYSGNPKVFTKFHVVGVAADTVNDAKG